MRRVVFEVLELGGAPLEADDREALLALVDARVRAAVKEFENVRAAERAHAQADLEKAKASLEQTVQERTSELMQTELRFRNLVEGVKDYAIFTVDPSGVITSWNPGAERMKGHTAQEAIGAHFSMLYPEEGRRRDEPMAHLRAAKIEGRFRGEGMREDGGPADRAVAP